MNETRLVLHPFLHSVPSDALRCARSLLCEAKEWPGERALQEAEHGRLRAVVCVDRLVWLSAEEHQLLCAVKGGSTEASFGSSEQAGFFRDVGLILPEDRASRAHAYSNFELEINRHCNWRCNYCPVKDDPLPVGYMDMELFEVALERIAQYTPNAGHRKRTINLNHYNEPTLDKHFIERVRKIAQQKIGILLHTNGSMLNEQMIQGLKEAGNIDTVFINLGTDNAEEFRALTGSKHFERVMTNVKRMREVGLPVLVSVITDERTERAHEIKRNLENRLGEVRWWKTSKRRELANGADTLVRGAQHLSGCNFVYEQFSISWEGKAFLCSNDYRQEYVLGDIRTSTIAEIAEAEPMVRLRRQIFGLEPAPKRLICSACDLTQPRSELSERLWVGVGDWDAEDPFQHNLVDDVQQCIVSPAARAILQTNQ